MSEKSRAQPKWLHRAVAMIIVLAFYWTAHCETTEHVLSRGTDHVCRESKRRSLGNRYIPRWVKCFFWPAERADEAICGARWIDN